MELLKALAVDTRDENEVENEMGVEKYRKMRDFSETPEPEGKGSTQSKGSLKFVIQKHKASHLHYDFRLEHEGVLLSWAVPKGPSLNTKDKRLAIQTEDHPYEYRKFEGLIPKGQYGGGEVIIWDQGTFQPEHEGQPIKNKKDAEAAISEGMKNGVLKFILHGIKVKGSWTLIKLKGKEKEWLLIKHEDEFSGEQDITEENTSVISGLTVEDLASGDSSRNEEKKSSQSSVKRAMAKQSSDAIEAILDTLNSNKDKLNLEVDGFKIDMTSLDKVLWPGLGRKFPPITKRDYALYLAKISPVLLPHLKDRPLTLIRYPNGVESKKFFQKHWEHTLPPFVKTVRYFSEKEGIDQDFLLCDNLPTLMWLAQIADLELHTVHTRIDGEPDAKKMPKTFTGSLENINSSLLNYPDFLVLDLDPYLYSGKEAENEEPELNKRGFKKVCELGLRLKDTLDDLRLNAFVKTSGKTGLHIYVPVVRNLDNDELRSIAGTIATFCRNEYPDDVTIDWAVKKRTGKVFFDYNMNARGKTLASIYSPRNSVIGSVSTPLEWDELGKVYPTDFTMETIVERVQEKGDLWEDILSRKNDLMKLIRSREELQPTSKKKKAG